MIVQGPELVKWVEQKLDAHFFQAVGIGVFDGSIRAAIVFCEYNGRNIQAHIASDNSKAWCSRAFLKAVFRYAFDELKVRRITVPISATNLHAQRFVEKLGFSLEFVMPDGAADGDLHLYVMRSHECKWR